VLTNGLFRKTNALARLVTMSAVGGLLVAGVLLPAVAGLGVTARNAANKFEALSANLPGQLPQRSVILDSKGNVLAYFYGHIYGQSNQVIDRVPVSFNQIAPMMRDAIIAIEDSRYYQHGGIDIKGTIRAAIQDLHGGSVQGGSTIAQQYVKNVLILTAKNRAQATLATSDTLARKIRELRYAVAIEHQMTKDQLLAAYLNVAYFGQQAYGVEVAAERYFGTSAAALTLPQAALLAGVVENPSEYDPMSDPGAALTRRNTVLARMAQLHMITPAVATAAASSKVRLQPTTEPSGCVTSYAPFFCDYVTAVINTDPAFRQAATLLNGIGGLQIQTTISPKDQYAAQRAVNYQMPPNNSTYNPGHNADTEVVIQPGTGKIRAIAINRLYGAPTRANPDATTVDFAVGPRYHGGDGMQIGSTGKVYTMVAALLQGIPFGFSMNVPYSTTVTGYTNCKGGPAGVGPAPDYTPGEWQVHNDESERGGNYTLYTGTTYSINTFFARLEQRVGLCSVVQTAARMGLTRPDGTSLLKPDGRNNLSADNIPSFTLGAVNVTPLSVAAADATLPARGVFCQPIAVTSITDRNGRHLPVESAGCRRVLPTDIADAANYILAGDLTAGTASGAFSDGIGRPAASKTGTADSYYYAAFVGYTPDLLAAVVVGNPTDPINNPMTGSASCYRDPVYGLECAGSMYGSMAPGRTWQMTFEHAALAYPPPDFVSLSADSPFFNKGNGQYVPPTPKPRPSDNGGGGNGGRNGGGGHGRPPGP
jgi:membrane peptidoglycan carboxypeptidase